MASIMPSSDLVAQRVEAHILADGLAAGIFRARCRRVGVLVTGAAGPHRLPAAAPRGARSDPSRTCCVEKLRYLQLNMMGGQAERMCTSVAPELVEEARPSRAAACRARWNRPRTSSFLSRMSSGTGICFIFATRLRTSWFAGMNERGQVGVYLMNGRPKGVLLSVGIADGVRRCRNRARRPRSRPRGTRRVLASSRAMIGTVAVAHDLDVHALVVGVGIAVVQPTGTRRSSSRRAAGESVSIPHRP